MKALVRSIPSSLQFGRGHKWTDFVVVVRSPESAEFFFFFQACVTTDFHGNQRSNLSVIANFFFCSERQRELSCLVSHSLFPARPSHATSRKGTRFFQLV